ncbi:ferredoxin hydrogenase large subunit [Mobilisporobacter senegalensis]|uniref:Ferredoxin hydrogenase large subunit n=1 Tax=Mobilisporobacter senegalensis TaxID=1329262 RepID=A0A3N1XNR2_9FIRM|nr:4Fe-4S dicluster domain-containing protein [Mobilisporobacter senegalensis]ROR26377.1 ferredoxin hydrogenase large subunit [Mobilisporobacter senegalensis]
MLEKNYNLSNIKHEVLLEVAKLAKNNNLSDVDKLPYQMIEGPQSNFRCCIYKEREIISQRVRLAQGKSPSPTKENKNIVQVISSACEGCPIARYVVTDNCQKCMSKKCQQACKFDAISMTKDRAYIEASICKECGACAQACPYNAIADLMRPCKRSCPVDAISMDENNIVIINEERCINCGSCIKDCPFGAISDRSFMVDVIKLIQTGIPVYAEVAPAIEGQFGKGISIGALREGIKKLGFVDMYEAAIGADIVAVNEARELIRAKEDGHKMTTSCCPAFVNMIKKHFPTVIDCVSTTVSPMTVTARLIKSAHPDAVVVFIGPCIAKKGEVLESVTQDSADYALTFEELDVLFEAFEINLNTEERYLQQASIYGKQFASSGGVTKAVVQAIEEEGLNSEDYKVRQCNGADECKKALMILKSGKLPEDIIEGMACVGGCMNGPASRITGPVTMRNRNELLDQTDGRGIHENLNNYEKYNFSVHRK